MGEVIAKRDENLGLEMFQEVDLRKMNNDVGASGGVIRWERFLPRVVLRVLLVEADDSTRQIITALLKKCGYKVAAVSDGLKAWEVLRENANSIDLILTEVELPSISGFALLSLIMEHEVSKNIPVIMMSSNDSISTVYNCMLKGAADFLVKPIRRNELKNLWQHAWRRQRQSSVSKSSPRDESVTPKKIEATAENNSNHTSGYKVCELINKDKGSGDSQSSCTKPVVEVESTYMENIEDLSLLKWSGSTGSDPGPENHGEAVKSSQELPKHENEAGGQASFKNARGTCWNITVEPDSSQEYPYNTHEACVNNNLHLESSKDVIDLIGSFDNNLEFSSQNSDSNIVHKLCSSPQLDLSLRRSHFCVSEGQATDEKQTINHSDASAFAPYINKTLQPLRPIPSNFSCQDKEFETNPQTHNSDTSISTLNAQNNAQSNNDMFPKSTCSLAETDIAHSYTPREQTAPTTTRFENAFAGRPPLMHSQPGSSSASVDETCGGSKQQDEPAAHNVESSGDQKHELFDDRGHLDSSGATDQEMEVGVIYYGNGSNGCTVNGSSPHPVDLTGCGSDYGNLEGSSTHDGSQNHLHRSSLREAALNKFRLKRKDRCFEKKVRYESRKKLAEQRPRVKGQFVRQVQSHGAALGGEYC